MKRKVVATLDYGMRLSKPLQVLFWVGFVCGILMIPGFIAAYITENDVSWLYSLWFPIFGVIVFLYAIIHDICIAKLSKSGLQMLWSYAPIP